MKQKKRFIAGATCPACKASDTLRIWIEDEISFRDCIECGFLEDNSLKPADTNLAGTPSGNNWLNKANLISIKDATQTDSTSKNRP